MPKQTAFERAMDYGVRSDPYARYADLRKTPIERQPDGSFVVSSYNAVQALYHDPRVTSDMSKRPAPANASGEKAEEDLTAPKVDISRLDPPRHDRLRRLAMRQFGPPHRPRFIHDLQSSLADIVDGLIDGFDKNGGEIELIEQFAFPYPVEVIVKLLGVPAEDKPKIAEWGHILSTPSSDTESEQNPLKAGEAAINKLFLELNEYMAELLEKHRTNPGDDMLSKMMNDDGPDGRMDDDDLMATATLLLTAGHETTVNLIGNGSLLLLKRPDLRKRVANEQEYVTRFVEEVLRFESPVQYLPQRSALVDIEIMGTKIPKGSPIILMLGVANRDGERFPEADIFNADRSDNQHLGFGSGIHNCLGAALARLEAQIAFTKLFNRLKNPKLVAEPPFRKNAGLRGPEELRCAFDGVAPRSES
jgi:cytochrome P450